MISNSNWLYNGKLEIFLEIGKSWKNWKFSNFQEKKLEIFLEISKKISNISRKNLEIISKEIVFQFPGNFPTFIGKFLGNISNYFPGNFQVFLGNFQENHRKFPGKFPTCILSHKNVFFTFLDHINASFHTVLT